MKQKIFEKKKFAPCCAHCVHGKLSADEQNVLCLKKGVMLPESSCNKYEYDPLKRRPKKPLGMQQHDAEEFAL